MKKLALILASVFALAASADQAQCIMISAYSPAQLPSSASSVDGIRMSIFLGECQNIRGLDLGLIDLTEERAYGLQVGGFHFVRVNAYGAQFAAAGNWVDNDFYGLQCAGIMNVALHSSACMQVSACNCAIDSLAGLQAGLVNVAGPTKGAQLGLFNHLESGSGMQIGLVNSADALEGIQIGLVNRLGNSKWCKWTMLANINF